ncbi:hypothetical protein C8J55DRAFT_499602 [Lentinula edodes]|uniref:Uncharacterized protein n=1 Tax=Lentinula lateritia TaxID=40482 RepID=A0A9W9AZ10_9AGAR|nr:hypothetical protein C8J55DRAFT_499602 [Lentinula edodes]
MVAILLASLVLPGVVFPTPIIKDANSSTPFDSGSSTYTTAEIIWSCITTIFACTWIVVHPNVHYPLVSILGQGWYTPWHVPCC